MIKLRHHITFIVILFIALCFHIAHSQELQMEPALRTPAKSPSRAEPTVPSTVILQPIEKPAQFGPPQLPLYQQPQTIKRPSVDKTSKFEQFIAGTAPSTISTDLVQFGYDLFRQPPSSFAPIENVPVGPDYVIGPGDEMKITIWGQIEGKWSVAVDRDGNIDLPKIGILGVTGLSFQELKETINKEFSKYYTGYEMNVSMSALRTIRVYAVGNADSPGAYTVSSLSTLVTAMFEAGGPSKTGTMRDIQVKRNGETIVRFDMYDLLLKGDKTKDIRLMPEDVIFIPPVGPLAGIAGNVKNPAIYELSGEARLLDLIQMAGGLTSVAFKGRVQAQRIEDHQFRTIFEGDLISIEQDSEKNFVLKDGDLIKIFYVIDTKNTVTVAGAVANQGEYGITAGTTKVKDVISLAGGLLYYASPEAELTRVRVTPSGPETERHLIDIYKAQEEDLQNNMPLEVNDYLFVRTIPGWKLYQTASISGEVKFPGTYTVKKGEKLSSLIERAGDYTDKAYLRGAIFTRERVRNLQQRSLNEMISRLENELLAGGAVEASTAFSQEELSAKNLELQQKQRFIESLKSLRASGRMAIRLVHLRLLKGTEYDIELEEGDSLFIPVRNNVVDVVGAVMSRSSFIYSERFDYKDYIDMAGGYTKYADTDSVYTLKIDGTAMKLSRGLFGWNTPKSRWEIAGFEEKIKDIEPGDTIVVPEKLERIAWLREIKDITQILYQIAVTAGVTMLLF